MPWKNAKHVTEELVVAARALDEPAAIAICDDLIARARSDDKPFPLDQAKRALKVLRDKRMFALLERLADTFIQSGQSHVFIRRQYAQALLDQSRLSSAIHVLEKLVEDTGRKDLAEQAEARGLLGRAYKQMYLDGHGQATSRGRKTLEQAARYYHEVYRMAPPRYLWQGVNTVALLERAKRDDVRLRGFPPAKKLAQEVLGQAKTLDAGGKADIWTWASALEAAVALGRAEEVQACLRRYLTSEGIDAFELASTRRQLLEVWQLDPRSGMGAEVLPPLEARLLECSGAQMEVKPAELRTRGQSAIKLERVLGDTSYVPLNWYRRGLERCLRVARVETELDPDQGFGTGFLVRGSDLKESLGGGTYLVTNAHVVSKEGGSNALRPPQARVSFKALEGAEKRRFGVRAVRWESPPDRLDCAILELDSEVDLPASAYPVASQPPVLDEGARVYIIGHPRGGTLSFSLNDNHLLDYDHRLLHYRAPTEGGSSGSPVFNQDWDLLGLHHGGGLDMPRLHDKPGRYAANEGIRIDAIRAGIA
jgi:hypothetical protein